MVRIWNVGDPEPEDYPDLIDVDGSRWMWCEYDEDFLADYPPEPGEPGGNWWCEDGDSDLWDWAKVLEYAPLHEASSEEVESER